MGPLQAIQSGVKKTFQISARATRPEFWWFALACAVTIIGIILFASDQPPPSTQPDAAGPLLQFRQHIIARFGTVSATAWLAITIAGLSLLAAMFRRLRDINWSLAQAFFLTLFTVLFTIAFLFEATGAFYFLVTRTLYHIMFGPNPHMAEIILMVTMFSPIYFVTVMSDIVLLALGGPVLMLLAATSFIFMISRLSASTFVDLTPNEVHS